MSKNLQIRNMPDELHRRLKVRCAEEGVSMTTFVLREIERGLERPTLEEMLRRLAEAPRQETTVSAVELLRESRDERHER